ncbi:MAG TPA: RraA family protein [Terriglobia bacterium]|nr:RraA family protein [Terriglobia bacterium]
MKDNLPDQTWIETLRGIDTPTVANALELAQIRPRHEGFAPLELRCLFPELGRMCGYAVTAQVETVSQGNVKEEARYLDLFEAVFHSPKPAVVVCQEIGAHPSYATHCGEVMTTIFKQSGAVGLVSDSGVRDLPEVRALGFHYFARGAVASHANFRIVRVGVPVQILGFPIRPGELLHGDENGLIQVPAETCEGLLAAVAAIRTKEKSLMDFVRRPDFAPSQLKGRLFH